MTDTVNDDARDLADAAAGDQEAFARLFDRHAAIVLSLCRQKQPSMYTATRHPGKTTSGRPAGVR